MAYRSASPLFRSLSDAEEEAFRSHARVTDPPNLDHWTVYHPVCREEWTARGLGPAAPALPVMRSWAPEVIADASGQWTGNALRFRTQAEAEANVANLFSRWTGVRETRTVPSPDAPTHAWTSAGLETL